MRIALAIAAVALAGAAQAQPRPDFTGVWTNASVTQLERPAGLGPTLTEAEAKARAAASPLVARASADARPSDPNAGAPTDGAVIGFNSFWMDSGDAYAKVKGEIRSSWIVDPPDGRLPFTAAGKARFAEAAATRGRLDPAGPEHLAPNDRCLIGSRGSGGPGMLNNIYNSNYQIVQTPDAIAIVVEMVHDVRAIPILPSKAAAQAAHKPAVMAPWLGDSVAWWEGATLVIETLNVHPQQGAFGPIFQSPQARVTERLTRVSPREIFYEFLVEDPVHYTRPWRAEMTLTARPGLVYEYACHEGNYALQGILAGARRADTSAGR